jgi:hypothetical protein
VEGKEAKKQLNLIVWSFYTRVTKGQQIRLEPGPRIHQKRSPNFAAERICATIRLLWCLVVHFPRKWAYVVQVFCNRENVAHARGERNAESAKGET